MFLSRFVAVAWWLSAAILVVDDTPLNRPWLNHAPAELLLG